MTDYNDGKWHGWNGGECPVDKEARVEVRYSIAEYDGIIHASAGDYDWAVLDGASIIAFRVTKPAPPKPREWWAVFNDRLHIGMWPDLWRAEAVAAEVEGREIIHVREVLE